MAKISAGVLLGIGIAGVALIWLIILGYKLREHDRAEKWKRAVRKSIEEHRRQQEEWQREEHRRLKAERDHTSES